MCESFGEVELTIFNQINVLYFVALSIKGGFVLAGDLCNVVEESLDAVTVDFFE
jgi:hypothetical protein